MKFENWLYVVYYYPLRCVIGLLLQPNFLCVCVCMWERERERERGGERDTLSLFSKHNKEYTVEYQYKEILGTSEINLL